jgi:hypothetical protein
MPWEHTFRIGHVAIRVVSDHAACSEIIYPLLNLYTATEAEPDIRFVVRSSHEAIELSVNDEPLWSGSDTGEIAAAFEVHLYTRIMQHLVPAYTSIHASAIRMDDRACLFVGESGAGKSSLCTKAVLTGHAYLSDEFALLDDAGFIEPFPRPLQWGKTRHPAFSHRIMLADGRVSKAMFKFPDRHGKIVRNLLWLPENIVRASLPLGWVVLCRYQASALPAELLPIRRGEALMELPRHLHFQEPPEIMLKTLNHRLPDATVFFRLVFSDVHAAWDMLIQNL